MLGDTAARYAVARRKALAGISLVVPTETHIGGTRKFQVNKALDVHQYRSRTTSIAQIRVAKAAVISITYAIWCNWLGTS